MFRLLNEQSGGCSVRDCGGHRQRRGHLLSEFVLFQQRNLASQHHRSVDGLRIEVGDALQRRDGGGWKQRCRSVGWLHTRNHPEAHELRVSLVRHARHHAAAGAVETRDAHSLLKECAVLFQKHSKHVALDLFCAGVSTIVVVVKVVGCVACAASGRLGLLEAQSRGSSVEDITVVSNSFVALHILQGRNDPSASARLAVDGLSRSVKLSVAVVASSSRDACA